MGDNLQTDGLSLGKRLRLLTNQARTNAEAQNFIDILTEAANRGEDHVQFEDLREVLPTMVMSETALDWIRSNELGVQGQINPNTAKYEYTVSW